MSMPIALDSVWSHASMACTKVAVMAPGRVMAEPTTTHHAPASRAWRAWAGVPMWPSATMGRPVARAIPEMRLQLSLALPAVSSV